MKNQLLFFASVTIVILAGLFFRYLERRQMFETIKAVIEKGDTVDPALIAAISQGRSGPQADLRKGVLFLALATATGAAALLIGRPEAIGPILGVATFPGLVGLAYLFFHLLKPARRED